jgi:hypothetical protein
MNLTEEQKTIVSEWAANGAGLSEIQTRLADEFGIRLSYMDTRFLVLDLGAAIKDKVETPQKEDAKASAANAKSSPAAAPQNDGDNEDDDYQDNGGEYQDDDVEFVDDGGKGAQQEEGGAKNGVAVDVSPITRPGFALTGSAVFSDGVKAEWGITNDGRFALEADDPAYKPSRADLREFQIKLREIISKRGY